MLRRHWAHPGTRLCRGSRNRLARQEYDVDRRKTWDLVFSGRNFDYARIAARRSSQGSLWNVRPLHKGLSDWRDHCAAQIGCAALHFVSHDRAQRRDSARASAIDWQSYFRLRRLPGRVSLESFRQNFARNCFCRTKAEPDWQFDNRFCATRLFAVKRCRVLQSFSGLSDQADQETRVLAECLRRTRERRNRRGSASTGARRQRS